MERRKKPMLVITFTTTTAAMAMEAACSSGNGRLIPIPREISGSCGLAWCALPEDETHLMDIMEINNITYQEKKVIKMF